MRWSRVISQLYVTLQKVELLLLMVLGWNVTPVTAADFVEHILSRVPWSAEKKVLRQHSHVLAQLCCSMAGEYHAFGIFSITMQRFLGQDFLFVIFVIFSLGRGEKPALGCMSLLPYRFLPDFKTPNI